MVTTTASVLRAMMLASYWLPVPTWKAPPCTHTITGRLPWAGAGGAYTFRLRQSSSTEACANRPGYCGQAEPNCVALRVPTHAGAGCGAFHLKGPTGACP